MRNSKEEIQKQGEKLAFEHWKFLGEWSKTMWINGFIHGYKHGYEDALKEKRK